MVILIRYQGNFECLNFESLSEVNALYYKGMTFPGDPLQPLLVFQKTLTKYVIEEFTQSYVKIYLTIYIYKEIMKLCMHKYI